MKTCRKCAIEVGGDRKLCPLCQGTLIGDATPALWPANTKIKKRSLLYRLQLYAALIVVVLFLFGDFVLTGPEPPAKYISLVVAAWVLAFEIFLNRALHWSAVPVRIWNLACLAAAILMIFTGWYLGFLRMTLTLIIPIACGILLIVNFIFALIDRKDNVMVYLLCNIPVGLFPYIVMSIVKGRAYPTWAWRYCMLICVITILGIAIFKGKKMMAEISKRMHF
ncbi:MAG: DUF6320 domain-containing protein [Lachnospiraceae bacterium]|nr:DUF6320 domain-containing protein [Lachnospiraceae bacterium]